MSEEPNAAQLQRLQLLLDYWKHHNSEHLKWPGAVATASLLVITQVVGSFSKPESTLVVGIPLIVGGLVAGAMWHVATRAREIMGEIEELIERQSDFPFARDLLRTMHPPGVSGSTVLRTVMLALTCGMTLGGFLRVLGCMPGAILGTAFITTALLVRWKWGRSKTVREIPSETTTV